MTEKLVILKSKWQMNVEGWLVICLPPLLALTARLLAQGPTIVGAVAVFLTYFSVAPVGTAIAARLGWGELVTPEERRKRILDLILTRKPLRVMLVMGLASALWTASLFATFVDFNDRTGLALLSSLALISGVLYGVFCYRALRRQRAQIDTATREELPQETADGWLASFLGLYYACVIAGLGVGFGIGLLVPPPWSAVPLMLSMILGIAVASQIRQRRALTKRPLLWVNLRFGGALLVALLQFGVPFGALGALLPILLGDRSPWMSLFFAVGALLFGIFYVLVLWASARLTERGVSRSSA